MGLINRILGVALTLVAAAAALYVAVGLIEAVADTLLSIAAAVACGVVLVLLGRVAWSRRRCSRW